MSVSKTTETITKNVTHYLYRPKWGNVGTIFRVRNEITEDIKEYFPEDSLELISAAKVSRVRKDNYYHFTLLDVNEIDEIIDITFDNQGKAIL